MMLIRGAVRYPVTTAVCVILLVLFGTLALYRIPIQLTPSVDRAIVTVSTAWPSASPVEVERQIVQEQEEQLKSLENLDRMESVSSQGIGRITLTFQIGTDMQAALLAVFGYVPGFVAALGLYRVATDYGGIPTGMTVESALGVLALTCGMCLASGLLAVRKVHTADPADLF